MSPKQIKRTECLVYSRVNGWYTATNQWNKGKKAEWADRKSFKINENKL
jgi:hypothetical protein